MYVITADQVRSRQGPDAVDGAIRDLTAALGDELALPPDRAAGDEVQLVTGDAGAALRAILLLSRSRQWSVGLGVGPVRHPLGDSVRESTGPAFFAARTAVGRAKSKPSRFAIERMDDPEPARSAEAIVDLLLLLRARRTPEGWELHDLLHSGLTQAQSAERLGITPQAASARALAADLKAEYAATPAVARLIGSLDSEDA
jgi:hypothetical protein